MTKAAKKHLSVVIPFYNEAARLPQTLVLVCRYLREQPWTWEIILVDDGSTDNTADSINNLVDGHHIRLLSHAVNRGKGAAVRTGVLAARGDLVFFTDADLSTPIFELPKLLQAIDDGADIAIGSRALDRTLIEVSQPWHRQIIGQLGNWLIRKMLGVPFYDTQCGFKIFRRQYINKLFGDLFLTGWSFDFGVIYRAYRNGLMIKEVPVRWSHHGQSKFSPLKHYLTCLGDLIRLRLSDGRNWRRPAAALAVFLLPVVWFIFFRARYLINWDAGQLALGTLNFDMSMHQPHPPGYFLFVASGAALNIIFNDINLSLSLLSFAAAWLAVYFFFQTVKLLSDHQTAVWATLVFVSNPVLLYYQNTALTYTFEALTAAMLLYWALRSLTGQNTLWKTVVASGVLAGFRPSIVLVAAPFIIWQMWRERSMKKIFSIILLGIITLAIWLVPFSYVVGGISQLFNLTIGQLQIIRASPPQDLNLFNFLISAILFTLGSVLVLTFFSIYHWWRSEPKKWLVILLPLTIEVPFLVFVHFGEVGYLLALLPSFALLAVPTIRYLSKHALGIIIIAVVVALNLSLAYWPMALISQRKLSVINTTGVALHDKRLSSYLKILAQREPSQTLVLVLRGQYISDRGIVETYRYDDIRALEYYRPDHKFFDLPAVPGTFYVAYQGTYMKKEQRQIFYGKDAKNLLILADYLAAETLPTGLDLHQQTIGPEQTVYYGASLTGINAFSFLGFDLKRSGI